LFGTAGVKIAMRISPTQLRRRFCDSRTRSSFLGVVLRCRRLAYARWRRGADRRRRSQRAADPAATTTPPSVAGAPRARGTRSLAGTVSPPRGPRHPDIRVPPQSSPRVLHRESALPSRGSGPDDGGSSSELRQRGPSPAPWTTAASNRRRRGGAPAGAARGMVPRRRDKVVGAPAARPRGAPSPAPPRSGSRPPRSGRRRGSASSLAGSGPWHPWPARSSSLTSAPPPARASSSILRRPSSSARGSGHQRCCCLWRRGSWYPSMLRYPRTAVVTGKTGEGGRSVCNLEAAKGAAEVRENVTVFGGDRADMRRVCGFGGEGHEASPRSICALPS